MNRAQVAQHRAKQRSRQQRLYRLLADALHLHPADFVTSLRVFARWLLLGSAVGALAGTASAIFLASLNWATGFRLANPSLIFLLPIAGFAIGWVYYRFAGPAARGNNLVIDEVHENRQPIPLRMAPLVLFGTVTAHLFGASVGREGTALQMGASLADWLQRKLRLSQSDRRLMLLAGISGGFGSVFGTPVAGFVFALEVQSLGRVWYEGFIPCFVAALVGDLVTRAWGITHTLQPHLANIEIEPVLLLKVAAAGLCFGLTSLLFVELMHVISALSRKVFTYNPLRLFAGGIIVVLLALLLNTTDYLGLSLPLIKQSVDGSGVLPFAFLGKVVFTALSLGMGYMGGEVTPLFVMGSTLGFSLGRLLGVEPTFMASVGFISVFAAASNTPLACTLMGVELFGGGSLVYLGVGAFVAYLASGHRGIYATQRIALPKAPGLDARAGESLETLHHRRPTRLGLPPLPAQRPVRAIMTPDPVAVRADTPLTTIIDRVVREGVRSLPVLDAQGLVIGMITDNDLLRRNGLAVRLGLLSALTEGERAALTQDSRHDARAIMTSPAVTIQADAPLSEAHQRLVKHKLKRLPVVNAKGHLVGILTRSDVLRELTFSSPAPTWAVEGGETPIHWDAQVEHIMATDVPTATPDTPLNDILQLMLDCAQKRVVVVDATQKAVGIITDGDLLARVQDTTRPGLLKTLGALWRRGESTAANTMLISSNEIARDVMTGPVISVPFGTPARHALELLMEHQIKRLPVVDAEGHVLGLVGRAGLMQALLSSTPQE